MVTIVDREQLALAKEFFQLVHDELLDLADMSKQGGDRLVGIRYKLNNLKDAISKVAVEKEEKPPVVEPKIEKPVTPEPKPVKTLSYKKKKLY